MLKTVKSLVRIGFLMTLVALALAQNGVSVANSRKSANRTILVTNSYDVTAYPAYARGNVAPLSITVDMANPEGVARDTAGRICVTNSGTGTITVYPAASDGNVPPIAVIAGFQTQLLNPTAIALDSSGKIYVLNGGEDQINV